MSVVISKSNKEWNYKMGKTWVGGHVEAPNLSGGFHGLLKQWWDYYCPENAKVLLIAENKTIKKLFLHKHPKWDIDILDYYPTLQQGNDNIIVADFCKIGTIPANTYDFIISQAILEHIYDPFGAMQNAFQGLKPGGYVITHTCPPNFPYHKYPVDCIRFMIDWWSEIIKHVSTPVELVELYQNSEETHVFTCYKRSE